MKKSSVWKRRSKIRKLKTTGKKYIIPKKSRRRHNKHTRVLLLRRQRDPRLLQPQDKMASVTSSVAFAMKSSPKLSSKNNSRAQFTNKSSTKTNASRQNQSFVVRAIDAPWTAPKLDPNTPSPIFGGSTGGLLRKAQVRNVARCQESRVELRVSSEICTRCLLKI